MYYYSAIKDFLFSYSHADEPQYPCKFCDMKFWSHGGRRNHTLFSHENRRDHICTYCGKGFSTKTKLIRHSEVVSIVTNSK